MTPCMEDWKLALCGTADASPCSGHRCNGLQVKPFVIAVPIPFHPFLPIETRLVERKRRGSLADDNFVPVGHANRPSPTTSEIIPPLGANHGRRKGTRVSPFLPDKQFFILITACTCASNQQTIRSSADFCRASTSGCEIHNTRQWGSRIVAAFRWGNLASSWGRGSHDEDGKFGSRGKY